MRVLCTDHTCKHNKDTGYYGICEARSTPSPGYGGITRLLVETCKYKELTDNAVNTQRGSDASRSQSTN